MKKISSILAIILFGISCSLSAQENNGREQSSNNKIIGKPDVQIDSDLMTPEILWSFGRLSGQEVSPDGKTILYGVTYYSIPENKGNRELYSVDVDGSDFKQLTHSPKSEFNALWRPDGKKIGFLSSESGSVQLWEMNPDGSDRKQISNFDAGVTGFKYSPDQSKILYTREVPKPNKFAQLYQGLPQTSGRLMDDLMYRHWDHWVDSYSHVFVTDYNDGRPGKGLDIMKDEPYHSPLSPFGGIEQINWTPDSKAIAYTCKKLTGKAATLSTNSDIYLYELASAKTINLTEGMMGFDVSPVFSPDGKYMAWESMERDGYESDQNR